MKSMTPHGIIGLERVKSYVELGMNLRNDGPIQSLTHTDEYKFKSTTSMQILQFVMFKYGGGGM
jgi:hypothetical protein